MCPYCNIPITHGKAACTDCRPHHRRQRQARQRTTLIEMPHPEENYLVEKFCRLLESGKEHEYILNKHGNSDEVIQALLDAEDFVKL